MSSVRKDKGQHRSSSTSSGGGNGGSRIGSITATSPLASPTTPSTTTSSSSNEIDEWRTKAKSYKHKLRTLIELLRRERDDNEATFTDMENKLETAMKSEQIALKRTHEQTLLLDQLRARLDDATSQAALLRKENADLRHSLRYQQQQQLLSSSSSSSLSVSNPSPGSHRSRRSKRSSSNAIHSSDKDSSADDENSSNVALLKARILELEGNCEKALADLEHAQRSAVVKLQAAAQVVVRLENRLHEQNQLLAVAAPAVPAPLPPAAKIIKERPNGDELSRSDSSGRRHQTVHGSPTTPHRDKLKSSAPNQLSAGSAVAVSSPSVKKSSRNSGLLDSQPPAVRAPEAPSPRVTDSSRVQKSPARSVPADTPPPPPPAAPTDDSIPPPADTADIIDLQSMMAQLAARSAMASAAASAEMDMLNATIARSDTMLRASEDIRAVVRGKLERKPTYSRNKALDELVKEASADVGGD